MKQNYLIIFLFGLHLVYGQNSMTKFPISNLPSNEANSDYASYSAGNLFLVDQENLSDGSWTTEEKGYSELGEETFSSLDLARQLDVLNESTPFNVVHNATIERFIRVYLKNHREYFSKLLRKSKYYFPLFEQALDKHNLPLELKYLAVVESALSPTAVSKSGAKGLWQFTYGTATDYDLHIDSFIDERFDIISSTEAAIDYLSALYKRFNNWDLALAAYNSGPKNVIKAIQRAKGSTNFWDIRKYLPQETRSYVPAFYATMYLFHYSQYHDIQAVNADIFYIETDTIQIQQKISLEMVGSKLDIDQNLIESLNPQYRRDIVPIQPNRISSLRLPNNLILRFIEIEQELYTESKKYKVPNQSNRILIREDNSYLVKNGDSLYKIASDFGISLQQLKQWNGLETNYLIAGQRLVITDR